MSSHLVNIAEEGNNDAHYRYKRELLQLKVEGRGNGIKTVITNIGRVSESLGVPPEYPTKYFGLECAAQSKYDKKTKHAVVNGKFELREMENTLQNFIKKFVLCYKCKLPECSYEITKSEELKMNCRACGHIATVSPTEKLVTFILKHPPTNMTQKGSAANATSSTTVSSKKKSSHQMEDDDLEPEDQVQWSQDTSDEAVERRRREEGLSDNISALTGVSTSGADASSNDASTAAAADAKRRRRQQHEEEEEAASAAAQQAEEEQADADGRISPQQVLLKYMNLMMTNQQLPSSSSSSSSLTEEQDSSAQVSCNDYSPSIITQHLNSLYHALKQIQTTYEFSDKDIICLLFESVFSTMYAGKKSEETPLVTRIQLYAPLIRKLLNQHYQDKLILAYTEDYIATFSPRDVEAEVLPHVANLFLTLYQQDIIHDASVIVDWVMSTKKSKMVKDAALVQKMKAAARPFAKWAIEKGIVATE